MGAFDLVRNILVPDDEGDPKEAAAFRRKWRWESHEQVILRGTFTAGMQEAVGNSMMLADKQGKTKLASGTGRIKLLECMIVDWTMTSGHQKVPITFENIKRLPANYVNPLLEKCDEIASAMTEDEQEAFFDSVSEPMAGDYIETKVFPMP